MLPSTLPRRAATLLACLALLLMACQRPAPLDPGPPTPTTPPAAPAPTSTTGAATATAPAATELPAPTATAPAAAAPLPAPTLFEGTWDDRGPFAAGLREEQQGALDELPGASVYHLELALADDLQRIDGKEEVRYTNQESLPLDEIYFRLYPNLLGGSAEVANLRVNGAPVEPEYELEGTALRVRLPAPLQPGTQVVIAMDFAVEVPLTGEGNYGSFAFTEDVLALAHFYPIIAVYDEGGWNVEIPAEAGDIIYADSSFYRVRVTAPDSVVLAGSGVTVEEEAAGGTQRFTLVAGPMRDFYLAGSPRYTVQSEQVEGTTVNSYVLAEDEEEGAAVLADAVAALEVYNDIVGPYPFTELDLVATPNQALGIEYPGIVAITQRLYEPAPNNYPVATVREATVAHEVGHQWFYSLVGNDQLDEPWLDESLTQYLTWRYYLARYGPQGAEGFRQSLTGRWESLGSRPIPIGLPVEDYTPTEYGAIVYGRGPLFFEALADEVGPEGFDRLLRDYFERYRFGIATGAALKALAEEECGCDLTPLWQEWVLMPAPTPGG